MSLARTRGRHTEATPYPPYHSGVGSVGRIGRVFQIAPAHARARRHNREENIMSEQKPGTLLTRR